MLPVASPIGQEEFFIPKRNIITSDPLRELSVGYKDKCFFIQLPSGEKKCVQRYDLSGGLEITPSREALEGALKVGKIYLTIVGEDYKLRLGISGNGGGPICGAIAYWATKTVFYSGVSYVIGVNGSIVGAAAGSTVSALTTGDMMTKAVAGAVVGGVVKAAPSFSSGSVIRVSDITTTFKETLVMAGNVAAIESIAMTISRFFTFFPFCP